MLEKEYKQSLSRRYFLVVAKAGVIAVTGLILVPNLGSSTEAEVEALISKKLKGTLHKDGKIDFNIPEIAENGASVQFSVTVDSQMVAQNYVKEIHIFTDGNPTPIVASYYFTPLSGRASLTSRMRLAQKQHVLVLAIMSNNSAYITSKEITVAVGGCGG